MAFGLYDHAVHVIDCASIAERSYGMSRLCRGVYIQNTGRGFLGHSVELILRAIRGKLFISSDVRYVFAFEVSNTS